MPTRYTIHDAFEYRVSSVNLHLVGTVFAGWEVRIVKNCDRTDPKPVNNVFIFFLRTKNCFNFCEHMDKISRKGYRGPWADIGESCPR